MDMAHGRHISINGDFGKLLDCHMGIFAPIPTIHDELLTQGNWCHFCSSFLILAHISSSAFFRREDRSRLVLNKDTRQEMQKGWWVKEGDGG
jgi:hypothetical protein